MTHPELANLQSGCPILGRREWRITANGYENKCTKTH